MSKPELKNSCNIGYSDKIEALLQGSGYKITKRSLALLLFQEDEEILKLVKEREGERFPEIERLIQEAKSHYPQPLNYIISLRRQEEASAISSRVMIFQKNPLITFRERLSRIMMNPLTGAPILLFVLYYGLYQFVGVWGAGTLVDFLEDHIFITHINPWVTNLVNSTIPFKLIQDLLVGEYGVITLGVRYAFAIILPIVATFFFAFAIVEDTGYLPRLAMLVDQLFKRIGLSGRAVIPMVLGFGCDTMATMVTRTLPTKRERVISTLLLALAVPCSAQLGVILALLEGRPKVMLIWAIVVVLVFLAVGFLSSKLLAGTPPSFYMEVPPL